MSTDHTSDPMADHGEVFPPPLLYPTRVWYSFCHEGGHTGSPREAEMTSITRTEQAKARATDLPREISRDELQALPEGAIFQWITTQECLGGGASIVLDIRFRLTSLPAPDPGSLEVM